MIAQALKPRVPAGEPPSSQCNVNQLLLELLQGSNIYTNRIIRVLLKDADPLAFWGKSSTECGPVCFEVQGIGRRGDLPVLVVATTLLNPCCRSCLGLPRCGIFHHLYRDFGSVKHSTHLPVSIGLNELPGVFPAWPTSIDTRRTPELPVTLRQLFGSCSIGLQKFYHLLRTSYKLLVTILTSNVRTRECGVSDMIA
jgi:hypothetical protein